MKHVTLLAMVAFLGGTFSLNQAARAEAVGLGLSLDQHQTLDALKGIYEGDCVRTDSSGDGQIKENVDKLQVSFNTLGELYLVRKVMDSKGEYNLPLTVYSKINQGVVESCISGGLIVGGKCSKVETVFKNGVITKYLMKGTGLLSMIKSPVRVLTESMEIKENGNLEVKTEFNEQGSFATICQFQRVP